ncbi:MAG TPA: ATP-binding protein [Candidatus Acidoferrales bacterium]|nr:ATP-binding protein [Candidatus Acidoferrales bacterium]
MRGSNRKRKVWMIAGGVVVTLLAAGIFTLGSLRIPLYPDEGTPAAALFAVSLFIFAAFMVFTLILMRSLVRLWAERRSGQLGSRFKTKMVLGAMGVSLLPVVFMFLFSYALVNRTLNSWFPRPLEIANEQSQKLIADFSQREFDRLKVYATAEAQLLSGRRKGSEADFLPGTDPPVFWVSDASQKAQVLRGPADVNTANAAAKSDQPQFVRTLVGGAEVWRAWGAYYLAGSAAYKGGSVVMARKLPAEFMDRYFDIESQTSTYAQQKQNLRLYKREIVVALALITLLLLFTTTWVALFLSKQVTVPIQSLAEATREIAHGNFDHRIEIQAQDELGTLVRSFNRMTVQLGEGRKQINEFTHSLEQAVEERDRRRKMMEAILENIPTGVISLTPAGEITRINSAVETILGSYAKDANTLQDLLGEEAARSVLYLMRRSLRMGAASREIEIASGGRLVRTAVTVSSLGPRRSNPGFVVVIDDLTDLLRAQKASAWQEVAQRIAHEIKNPLTPIQLSAQRLLRFLERAAGATPGTPRTDFEKLVAECAGLIQREVQTLQSLVEEFSQFARFPAAKLVLTDVNTMVESAVELFRGRLDGITVKTELSENVPPIKADPELMRRVVANLIDNAAEAMESSTLRQMSVSTHVVSDGDAVEIHVADTGQGISPEDKLKLFLPHFSTKDRGTGLGLAIASRIVAEHNGTIRAENNLPVGTRFVIRFPVAEAIPAATPTESAVVQ